jgi:hypothetical protein
VRQDLVDKIIQMMPSVFEDFRKVSRCCEGTKRQICTTSEVARSSMSIGRCRSKILVTPSTCSSGCPCPESSRSTGRHMAPCHRDSPGGRHFKSLSPLGSTKRPRQLGPGLSLCTGLAICENDHVLSKYACGPTHCVLEPPSRASWRLRAGRRRDDGPLDGDDARRRDGEQPPDGGAHSTDGSLTAPFLVSSLTSESRGQECSRHGYRSGQSLLPTRIQLVWIEVP